MMATSATTLLIASLIHGEIFRRYAEDEVFRQLFRQSKSTGQQIEGYLGTHISAIRALSAAAQQLRPFDRVSLDRLLDHYHEVYGGFITMLAADVRGTMLAASPRTMPDGRKVLQTSQSIADREYFRAAISGRDVFVSPVFRGRGFGNDPIIAISAPVLDDKGEPVMVVEGSLNLGALKRLEPSGDPGEKISLAILDRNLTVVYCSAGLPFRILASAVDSPLLKAAQRSAGPVFRNGREGRTQSIATVTRLAASGWQIIVQGSLSGVEARLNHYRELTVMVLLFSLLICLLLADTIGARFVRPLRILVSRLDGFDPGRAPEVLAEPRDASEEVANLISHWNRLAGRLQESYEALRTHMAELEEAKLRAQAADRAKTRFLANITHELRTPLNGIIGTSEWLLREPLAEDQMDALRTMRWSADALLRIVDDILEVARLEADQVVFRKTPFRLRQAVTDVTELYFPEAVRKGLLAYCEIAPDVPEWLEGDPTQIRQVLSKLIGNAVKFTDTGRIGVEVWIEERLPLRVNFRITDTGIGIATEALDRIFQPFRQSDEASNRRFGGTGLGLVVAKRLIEGMGGILSVESQEGQGSTFSFQVPFEAAHSPYAHPSETLQQGNGNSVLVAEDNPVNRLVAKRLLEKLGYRVDIAVDGVAAVDAAQRNDYSVILMDCQMPNMDGFEATAEIRRLRGSIRVPIVAMTANALDGDRERCLRAGMDDYLAKPLELRALAALLLRWTGQRAV